MKQLIPVLALIAAGGAAAQSSPWYVGLSQSLGRDSNVFRSADGQEQSSGLISGSRLVGGLDIRPGRQRLVADLSLSRNTYADQKQLDFDGYGLNATLDWETALKLSGQLSIGLQRQQGSFNSTATPTGTGRNIEEPRNIAALVRFGDYARSRLWFEADVRHDEQRSDVDLGAVSPLFGVIDATGYQRRHLIDRVSGGVRYRLGGSLVVGAGVSGTWGQDGYRVERVAPAIVRIDDDYDRQDIDVIANWIPSGASRVFARISYGRLETESTLLRNDRSGATAAVRWEWEPTGKLATALRLAYDDNTRERDGGLDNADEPAASVDLQARFAISGKLSASAGMNYIHRRLDSELPGSRTDERQNFRLGIDWQVLNAVSVGCSVSLDRRSESQISAGYDATATFCTLRAVLQ